MDTPHVSMAAPRRTEKRLGWAASAASNKIAVITQKSVFAYSDSMPHISQQSVPGGTRTSVPSQAPLLLYNAFSDYKGVMTQENRHPATHTHTTPSLSPSCSRGTAQCSAICLRQTLDRFIGSYLETILLTSELFPCFKSILQVQDFYASVIW